MVPTDARTQGPGSLSDRPKVEILFPAGGHGDRNSPYTLVISDQSGRTLFREEDTLARFLAWLGGRRGSTETLFGEREQGVQEGRITLLEFLPGQAGPYRILLEIGARAADETPGSSSCWEVLEAELTVKEDVIHLSRIVKYPHKKVHI